MSSNQTSKSDAQRIQSTQATGGKDTGAGSFAARAQSAGDKNANADAAKGSAGASGTTGAQGQGQGGSKEGDGK